MKKYLLVFIALLLTAAVVTATMLNGNRKPAVVKSKTECPRKECCQKKNCQM